VIGAVWVRVVGICECVGLDTISWNTTSVLHMYPCPIVAGRPTTRHLSTQTFLLATFRFVFFAPSSLLGILSIFIVSTPSGISASSSSNTPWHMPRMSRSSSSEKREPAYHHLLVPRPRHKKLGNKNVEMENAPLQSPVPA
jgi:hypothetical protein